jgi:hypothetical protein
MQECLVITYNALFPLKSRQNLMRICLPNFGRDGFQFQIPASARNVILPGVGRAKQGEAKALGRLAILCAKRALPV